MSDNQSGVVANFNKLVDFKDVKFSFRTVKDEATGLESKRPTIEGKIPVPSVEGVIAILEEGGKGLDLLMEAVAAISFQRAREILADDEKITALDDAFIAQLSWDAIANLPPSERKGRGIPAETWKAFAEDYTATMPAVTGKTAEQVGNAAKILVNKFNAVRTNKPVINMLKGQLAIYINSSANAETYADCAEFLLSKADALLQRDEAALLDAL